MPAGRARAHGAAAAAGELRRRWRRGAGSGHAQAHEETGAVFMMGQNPTLPVMPDEADAARFLPLPVLRHRVPAPAAEREDSRWMPARARPWCGMPAARHLQWRVAAHRPRLLGRADDRPLRERGGGLGRRSTTRRCATSPTKPPASSIRMPTTSSSGRTTSRRNTSATAHEKPASTAGT